jgi:hypothetical protein
MVTRQMEIRRRTDMWSTKVERRMKKSKRREGKRAGEGSSPALKSETIGDEMTRGGSAGQSRHFGLKDRGFDRTYMCGTINYVCFSLARVFQSD